MVPYRLSLGDEITAPRVTSCRFLFDKWPPVIVVSVCLSLRAHYLSWCILGLVGRLSWSVIVVTAEMSSGSTALQVDGNGKPGNVANSCPLFGCKRVYTDMAALDSHIKDHEIPVQSLPGKVFLCSTIGCSGSFPSMQKLMEHMRHHHKPNFFFLCESCRAKLRSYRGLLTHLHTCSKVLRGKVRAAEPPPIQVKQSTSPTTADHDTPHQDLLQFSSHIQTTESSPAGVSQPDSAAVLNPPLKQDPSSPQQSTEVASQPQLKPEAYNQSIMNAQTVPTEPLETQSQHQPQTKSPQSVHPSPGSSSHSPPGSTAVWRKNQGPSCNVRIVWEHTRGRYRCVQCSFSTANRRDMTAHINAQHNVNKPTGDAGSPAGNA